MKKRISGKILCICLLISMNAKASGLRPELKYPPQVAESEDVRALTYAIDRIEMQDQPPASQSLNPGMRLEHPPQGEESQGMMFPALDLPSMVEAAFGSQDILYHQFSKSTVGDCQTLFQEAHILEASSRVSSALCDIEKRLASLGEMEGGYRIIAPRSKSFVSTLEKIASSLSGAKTQLDGFMKALYPDYSPQEWPLITHVSGLQEATYKMNQLWYDFAAANLFLTVPVSEEAYKTSATQVADVFNSAYVAQAVQNLNPLIEAFSFSLSQLRECLNAYKQGQGQDIPYIWDQLTHLFHGNKVLMERYNALPDKTAVFEQMKGGIRELKHGLYTLGIFCQVKKKSRLMQKFPEISPRVIDALTAESTREQARGQSLLSAQDPQLVRGDIPGDQKSSFSSNQSNFPYQDAEAALQTFVTLPSLELSSIVEATFGNKKGFPQEFCSKLEETKLLLIGLGHKTWNSLIGKSLFFDTCSTLRWNVVEIYTMLSFKGVDQESIDLFISDKTLNHGDSLNIEWRYGDEWAERVSEKKRFNLNDISNHYEVKKIQTILGRLTTLFSGAKIKLDACMTDIRPGFVQKEWALLRHLTVLQDILKQMDQIRYNFAAATLLLSHDPQTISQTEDEYKNNIYKVNAYFTKDYSHKALQYLEHLKVNFINAAWELSFCISHYLDYQKGSAPRCEMTYIWDQLSKLLEGNNELVQNFNIPENKTKRFESMREGLAELKEGLYLLGRFRKESGNVILQLIKKIPVISQEAEYTLYPVAKKKAAKKMTKQKAREEQLYQTAKSSQEPVIEDTRAIEEEEEKIDNAELRQQQAAWRANQMLMEEPQDQKAAILKDAQIVEEVELLEDETPAEEESFDPRKEHQENRLRKKLISIQNQYSQKPFEKTNQTVFLCDLEKAQSSLYWDEIRELIPLFIDARINHRGGGSLEIFDHYGAREVHLERKDRVKIRIGTEIIKQPWELWKIYPGGYQQDNRFPHPYRLYLYFLTPEQYEKYLTSTIPKALLSDQQKAELDLIHTPNPNLRPKGAVLYLGVGHTTRKNPVKVITNPHRGK